MPEQVLRRVGHLGANEAPIPRMLAVDCERPATAVA
jgi:hypothetical protein